MKLAPLADKILVKRLEPKDRTPGGILLPDSAKEKPQKAKVLEVGPGKRDKDGTLIPLTVKVGQTVLFSRYAGTELPDLDDLHLILREEDVLAVVVES